MHFVYAFNVLKLIRDDKLNIIVNTTYWKTSNYCYANINNYKIPVYSNDEYFSEIKNNKCIIADKKNAHSSFRFYSLDSALLDINEYSKILKVKSKYLIAPCCRISINNIKLLPDDQDEAWKFLENSIELLSESFLFILYQKIEFLWLRFSKTWKICFKKSKLYFHWLL